MLHIFEGKIATLITWNVFCIRYLSMLLYLFMYSIIHLHQYGPMDICFIIWIIIHNYICMYITYIIYMIYIYIYFFFLLKLFLDLTIVSSFSWYLSHTHPPYYGNIVCVSSCYLSWIISHFLALQDVPGSSCIFPAPILELAAYPGSSVLWLENFIRSQDPATRYFYYSCGIFAPMPSAYKTRGHLSV